MIKRSNLRDSYYKKTLNYWKTMNTTATPTIEYVKWLENIILDNGLNEPTTEADTSEANLTIPVVINSLSDLDGKTVSVKFKVTKYKPNIVLDIDLANDC